MGSDYNKDGIQESNELAEIISEDIYLKLRLISFLQKVPEKNRKTSFLHDVKVLFASQNFNNLKQDNIVIETDIFYIPDSDESNNGIGNYYSYEKQGSTYLGKTYIVNPYKVKEYNQEFNTWLRKCIHGELILEIDGISTDPGPGSYDEKESKFVQTNHQDVDDWFVLYLLNKFSEERIKVAVSDEICVTDYTRIHKAYNNDNSYFLFLSSILVITLGIYIKFYNSKNVISLIIYLISLLIVSAMFKFLTSKKEFEERSIGFVGEKIY